MVKDQNCRKDAAKCPPSSVMMFVGAHTFMWPGGVMYKQHFRQYSCGTNSIKVSIHTFSVSTRQAEQLLSLLAEG